MDYIEDIRNSFGDAFLTLPLLLIGFSFFFGVLTSNTGLLYLFLGQLLVVPAVQKLINTKGRFWIDKKDPTKKDWPEIIRWIMSLVGVMTVNGAPYFSTISYIKDFALLPIFLIAQLFLVNNFETTVPESAKCSMLPQSETAEIYTSPSSWVAQIVFFCSFIFFNAIGIYKEPAPELQNVPEDQKSERQKKLDDRVANRKYISGTILFMTLGALLLLLFFRYKYTSCESGFLSTLPGIALIFMTGSSWYDLIYSYCGVRPADVLGIVQGLINPDLIDNPIVCVGS